MHVLSTKQFLDHAKLEELFAAADLLEKQDAAGSIPPVLAGKILATVFYEPSTRTRFSFEAGMLKLGGQVITTESAAHFSSAVKGETIEDSTKVISGFADVIVMRHPEQGAAERAAKVSAVPVINGGDGIGEHPSQALYDLYTIKKELGRVDGLHVAFVGDMKNGRTVKSLLTLLNSYQDVRISLISPEALALPPERIEELKQKNVNFEVSTSLESALKDADVFYVTRVQKERFASVEEYEKLKDSYIIDAKTLASMKDRSIIMHPLPRVNEISTEVDSDPRAAYFRQAKNGLYVRMALLASVLQP
jgi:aspartate carbamoyltransferase catalytic subunit